MTQPLEELAERILRWDEANARPLPWRGEADPYRVWISEIMLQQTRAEAVIPYYHRFLLDFPTIDALAKADLQQVLKRWEGLGYYSRARNLHEAARRVMAEHGGIFPREYSAIRALPGIGEYTAGAIASIAFGQPLPAIDGNQIRVLTRLFEIYENPAGAEGKRRIRAAAQALLPADRPGDFNQALMGIGATICLPGRPRCETCPASEHCKTQRTRRFSEIPAPSEKGRQRVVPVAVALIFSGAHVLVRQRPADGLLGGLWELPCIQEARTRAEVLAGLAEMGVHPGKLRRTTRAEHRFTHRIWKMTGWTGRVEEIPEGSRFVTARELEDLPMATAIRMYREEALRGLNEGETM